MKLPRASDSNAPPIGLPASAATETANEFVPNRKPSSDVGDSCATQAGIMATKLPEVNPYTPANTILPAKEVVGAQTARMNIAVRHVIDTITLNLPNLSPIHDGMILPRMLCGHQQSAIPFWDAVLTSRHWQLPAELNLHLMASAGV